MLHKFGDHLGDHQIYTAAIFIASNHLGDHQIYAVLKIAMLRMLHKFGDTV